MSTEDDFEIRASVRARRLTSHSLTEATTRGEAVRVARRGERSGLPTPIEPEEEYEEIVLETQLLGQLATDR